MSDDTDLRDEYKREFKASALRYQQRDPKGYVAILTACMDGYTGTPGEYVRRMLDVQRRCASASHFPSFAVWCDTRAQQLSTQGAA